MIQNPAISVVIPSYNNSCFIEAAVRSVLEQTYPASEIIVVDDGSTDGTAEVLASYVERDLVTYLWQENGGPAAARNRGISVSKSEYLCFLDADDTLYPNSIQERIEIYEKHPGLGLVFSDNRKVIQKGGINIVYRENDLLESNLVRDTLKDHIISVDEEAYLLSTGVFCELAMRCFIWTGTVMVRRSVLDDVGNFDEDLKIAEDHDLWLRICRKYEIGFLNRSTATYLMHDGGTTKNKSLYYDSGITVSYRYLAELPIKYQKKLVRQIALYAFTKGYDLYEKELFFEANRAFKQALGRNPLELRYYIFYAFTLLPSSLIKKLRGFKKLLHASNNGSPADAPTTFGPRN